MINDVAVSICVNEVRFVLLVYLKKNSLKLIKLFFHFIMFKFNLF